MLYPIGLFQSVQALREEAYGAIPPIAKGRLHENLPVNLSMYDAEISDWRSPRSQISVIEMRKYSLGHRRRLRGSQFRKPG